MWGETVVSTRPAARLTAAQYLGFERASTVKHEFFAGEMFAMVGASRNHNLIVVNAGSELREQLKGKACEVFVNDMRVKVSASGLYTYPDLVVVCGQALFEDETQDTLLNPVVIGEILSPSTEKYDRGKKFEHYRKLESLAEYLLIAQDEPRVEHYVRQADGNWLFSEVTEVDGHVELPAIACRLKLAEVYDKTPFAR